MTGIMQLDLAKLVKAMDGKDMCFFTREDGTPVSDKDAREVVAAYMADHIARIPMREDDAIKTDRPKDTRADKLRRKIRSAEQDVVDYCRRNNVLQAPRRLYARIEALKDELREEEAYEPKRLREILTEDVMEEHGIGQKMVKVHIAADFLGYVAEVLRKALDDCGIAHCSIYPIVDDIRRKARDFAAIVCHPEFGDLHEFFKENDPLLDGMEDLCDKYMDKHLVIGRHEL